MDRIGRSLRFGHQVFDKEAFTNGCNNENSGISVEGFRILSQLSFCGPCGPCFHYKNPNIYN